MSLETNNYGRREFLYRLGKTTAAVGGVAGAAYFLYDKKGPSADIGREKTVELPDFSVPFEDGRVISVVQGGGRSSGIKKAVDLLGGIERFVKAGDTVVIKPNAAFASPPLLGATTNPEIVAEVVRLCYGRGGARKVIVTDNPINDSQSCFVASGIGRAASEAGAEVVLPREHLFRPVSIAGGKLIRNWPVLYGPLSGADKLIGISPIKDHQRAVASMSMKNWYGLLGGSRNIFHQDINTIIAELSVMVKPTLVVLDGTEVMVTNGPTGGSVADLRKANTVIASCDMVAADSYACRFLGLDISDLAYLGRAEEMSGGATDFESLRPKIAGLG